MQRFVKSKKICFLTDPRTRLRRCPVREALRPSYAYPSTSNGHNRTRDVLQMYPLLRGQERASSTGAFWKRMMMFLLRRGEAFRVSEN